MSKQVIAAAVSILGVLVCSATGCTTPAKGEGGNLDQVSVGGPLFLANCSSCHGDAGQGTDKAPPVVGVKALPLKPPPTAKIRTTEFRTAKDVLDFIRTNMPPKSASGAASALNEAQYEDILAFDLKANGIDLHDVRVTDANAVTFVIHP